ncbi:hypothetical protein BL253_29175 [Pseudofrankia asymbiotica]|uniref:Uncharacterized protein n=2 Tax=Pseudofrankia asymbiotica TaxID=1834516 RepID=A0A1V2I379_9ACTN|nr:hypothetical protein BL253_29175 [Pseudofrankia asymbiotica]
MDPIGTPRSGMDITELAAEHVELLPERMTLAVIHNGESIGTGNNSPVNSPGSNNIVTGNSSMVQTIGNANPFIQSVASGDSFFDQW